jgi:hypothetical protein
MQGVVSWNKIQRLKLLKPSLNDTLPEELQRLVEINSIKQPIVNIVTKVED